MQQPRKGKLRGSQKKNIMPFGNRIELNRQTQFHECIDFSFHSKGVEFKKKSGNKMDTGHASLREQPVWSHREWDLGCTHFLFSRIHPVHHRLLTNLRASKSVETKLILAFPHPHLLVVYFFLSLSISLWSSPNASWSGEVLICMSHLSGACGF